MWFDSITNEIFTKKSNRRETEEVNLNVVLSVTAKVGKDDFNRKKLPNYRVSACIVPNCQ